mmetsp:Transcript_84637/g.239915  ORF Transcript_84637/g.239915 Transcript_84637/m.239915 type:complete len:230 (-) Transcript_84637:478-1167(-)
MYSVEAEALACTASAQLLTFAQAQFAPPVMASRFVYPVNPTAPPLTSPAIPPTEVPMTRPAPLPTIAPSGMERPKVKSAGGIPHATPAIPPAITPVAPPLAPIVAAPPTADARVTWYFWFETAARVSEARTEALLLANSAAADAFAPAHPAALLSPLRTAVTLAVTNTEVLSAAVFTGEGTYRSAIAWALAMASATLTLQASMQATAATLRSWKASTAFPSLAVLSSAA